MPCNKGKPTRARCRFIYKSYQVCQLDTNILTLFLLQLNGLDAILIAGASNTLFMSVATPTVSGVLSCPEFNTLNLRMYTFYGRGASVINRKGKAGGMDMDMLLTPSPPYTLSKVKGGYQSRSGDMTMSILWGSLAHIKTLFLSFQRQDQPVIIVGVLALVCLLALEVLS